MQTKTVDVRWTVSMSTPWPTRVSVFLGHCRVLSVVMGTFSESLPRPPNF